MVYCRQVAVKDVYNFYLVLKDRSHTVLRNAVAYNLANLIDIEQNQYGVYACERLERLVLVAGKCCDILSKEVNEHFEKRPL